MATLVWKGDAKPVAQVQSYAFAGTWEADDLVRVTVGSKTVDVTAGSTTTNTVVDNVVTALNALSATTYPEFTGTTGFTASRSGSSLLLTANTAGVPFTATLTPLESNGGAADSQTIEGGTSATTGTASTASAGPNDWSTAGNWSTGSVPTTGDDVYLENSVIDVLYGLAQSGVTLTSLNVAASYTGKIGLPERNAAGYQEYRATVLAISATTVNVGRGVGSGSSRIKLNTGSNASTVNVWRTSTPEEAGRQALLWKGAHASNVLNVYRGSVGVAAFAGDTATLPTLRVSYVDGVENDAQVYVGSGTTLTTLTMVGGSVQLLGGATTVTQSAGTLEVLAGAVGTLTVDGGTCYYDSTGTLTTGTVAGKGRLSFERDARSKTVTNPIEKYGDESLFDDPVRVVASLVVDLNYASDLSKLNLGRNVRLTRGTPS